MMVGENFANRFAVRVEANDGDTEPGHQARRLVMTADTIDSAVNFEETVSFAAIFASTSRAMAACKILSNLGAGNVLGKPAGKSVGRVGDKETGFARRAQPLDTRATTGCFGAMEWAAIARCIAEELRNKDCCTDCYQRRAHLDKNLPL